MRKKNIFFVRHDLHSIFRVLQTKFYRISKYSLNYELSISVQWIHDGDCSLQCHEHWPKSRDISGWCPPLVERRYEVTQKTPLRRCSRTPSIVSVLRVKTLWKSMRVLSHSSLFVKKLSWGLLLPLNHLKVYFSRGMLNHSDWRSSEWIPLIKEKTRFQSDKLHKPQWMYI